MTYLIIGSKGQLGTELSKLLPQALTADYTELDITDAAAVKSYVSTHAVDVIINCAAYTAVDKAEDDPEKAAAVNVTGVANLAASGAAVIHISTDYVFDGSGHRPYTPQDTPRPISVYGRTKLAGEQALMETAETAIIIRTAWLYSPHGNNFVKTMLRLGSERKDINVVCDQIGSPTSAADLAAAICAILPRLKKGMKGIYHYTNEGVCSWYDFAVEIMALGKRNCNVHPILSSQYPTKATRPFYSVLDKTAIRNDFGITIPHWKESLSTCMQELGELKSHHPQHTFSMMHSKSKERRYVRFLACLIPSRKARHQFRARHLNVDSGPPPLFIVKAHNTLIRLLAIFTLSPAKRREFRKKHLIKHVAITSPRYRGCKANKTQGKGSVLLSIKRPGKWERYLASFKPPRFSVIVASYNYSGFIVETLDSLLGQTYRNFEIIVVDDGSKDNSIEVIRHYMDKYPKRIRLYTHKGNANKGLAETVKLGLSKCQGDYVCFCESDDYWAPNHLEELAFVIRTWKKVAMIANNIELAGDVTPEMKSYIKHCRDITGSNVQKINVFETLFNPAPSFSACCVKRDVLEKCDFNTPVAAWLDWWLWRQILVEHPLHYILQRTTYWRIHNTSFLSKEKEAGLDEMKRLHQFIAASNLYILKKLYSRKNGQLPFRKSQISGYNECLHSSLFDEKYYRKTHMQDCIQKMDAVLHYVLVGWRLGYDPSPYFSTKKYLIRRPDIDRAGINPLIHYDTSGRMEMPGDSFPVANTYIFHKPVGFDREAFMQDRNKILLVSHMLNYTGAPMLLMNVAEVLRGSGCHAAILCSQDGVLRAELLNRGIPVIIDDGAFCDHDGYKRYVEEGYAFCLVNTVISYGALCVFKDHIPCAWWIHENILNDSEISHTLRKLFATFKNIYVPSELTKSYLESHCGDLQILTYPVKDSVGDAFALKKETDVLRCAVVASYHDRKAQDILIKALALLPKAQNTHIHVRLFGEETSSGYTHYLQELSKDLPNVVFEPVIRDRAKYHAIYEDIDVLICPSREDPYPLVVIDALMHGCPVVISDHVGQKHLIENGKNGYVFESENPQDLAEKLGEMIDNKNSLPAMSLAARELYLKSFDYAACSKAFLHMVEKTCKSK